ncbi:MAG TPA: glycoside hydrolase family 38 C-terminal domain-containing protein [Terracidiphilus sp.]
MNSASPLRFVHFFSLGLLAASTLFATRATAQNATEAAKIETMLPTDARAVIDRLTMLRELSDGIWKMHGSDLAHGEAVTLDDSDWQPIALKSTTTNDAVWFRQSYVVPATLGGYDLTGARIWFQFHANANGPMPEILYFNGRRVAMGDDLEPTPLFESARPGDRVTVAVKLLHTVDVKTFLGATLKIDFPEGRPNPEDLREEFLSAALLVPALAPNDPAPLATLNSAIQSVDLAALDASDQKKFDASLRAARTHLEALKPLLQQVTFHLTGNSHIDAAWLWPWTETVDVVKRTFGTALQLMYEYPDYTYTQSAAAYNEWIADKYPSMNAEIARRIKEGRWEIVGGMWVEPDLNMPDGESLVRQILVGKRWFKQAYGVDVRVGWNPDSFGYTWQLPQIYKKSGIDYFVTQKMAWNDTNQMPFKFFWWESPDGSKVLSYFPHDYANDNLNPVRLARDFVIAQKQATGLPSIMDLYGIGDHGGGPTRAILDEGYHWSGDGCTPSGAKATDSSGAATYGLKPVPFDGCGTEYVTPKFEFGTAQSYFTALEKQIAPESPVWNYQSIAKGYTPPPAVAGKVSIPTWKSELYFEYHRGVMTTQANHKKNMREGEVEMLDAEKWASLAWVLPGWESISYPGNELTEDWKKVLFNQFHDLAAGSGIGVIYKDAQKDYDQVHSSTNDISVRSLNRIIESMDAYTGKPKPSSRVLVVFNPLPWKRSGTVIAHIPGYDGFILDDMETGTHFRSYGITSLHEVDSVHNTYNYEIPVKDVPALGYKVFRITPGCNEKLCSWMDDTTLLHLDDFQKNPPYRSLTIENNYLKVKIDQDTGCIRSIVDVSNFDYIAPNSCANQLQFFKDTPKDYDAWNIDPGTLDNEIGTTIKADEVLGGNYEFQVTRHLGKSKFIQTIRLDGDQIDIDNDIDWHESHVLLKAAFPLAASGPFATYEIPYGTIDRPTTRNNSWEKAQFEVEALRWADLSGPGADGKIHGLSVLNQTKYGYDAVGNTLRLTLLRSPKWPDPDADMGHHHFHYALYPHAGTWKEALTVRHGYEYNYPLTAVVTTAHPGALPPSYSFASVSPENVVLTAVKKAEDANGLIFRVYEWAGKETTAEFHLPPGATGATVTNLMETPEGPPLSVKGDVVKVPIHPYEILTIRVDYPSGGPK